MRQANDNQSLRSGGNASDERGAVIVIFAMLLVPLLTFVAIGIDLARLAESREEAQYVARLSALAAVEGYFGATHLGDEARVAEATARANKILEDAKLLAHDGTPELEFGAGEGARLIPGIWHFEAPASGSCNGKADCFEDIETITETRKPNAFRVSGSLFGDVRPLVAHLVMLTDRFTLPVNAVAAVIPRHTCFLVDLSASVTRETHVSPPPVDPADGQGEEYALYLAADNGTAVTTSHDTAWATLGAAGARPGGDVDPKVHYVDDYTLKTSFIDDDYRDSDGVPHVAFAAHHPDPSLAANVRFQIGNTRKWYRVDTFRGGSYRGPEPLATIFDGLKYATQYFRSRRVNGDLACIIFYDQTITWPRIVLPTDDFDYLESFTEFAAAGAIAPDPAGISVADVAAESLTGLERTIRYQLFPRAKAKTDMTLAVKEAATQLSAVRSATVPSLDSIVLIGDGLTNCCDHKDCVPRCSNDLRHYDLSMWELGKYARNQLEPARVAVHTILVGGMVGPHTVDIARSDVDHHCMTDEQARLKNISYAVGGNYTMTNMSNGDWEDLFNNMTATPEGAFYQPNADLYRISKITRGIWAPLRPVAPGCTPADEDRLCPLAPTRAITDPYCRTSSEQIQDHINKILGTNPYVIVESS